MSRHRRIKVLSSTGLMAQIASLLLWVAAADCRAEIYRCVDQGGKAAYQDQPCADDAVESRRVEVPPSALIAEIGPWRCLDSPDSLQSAGIEKREGGEWIAELPAPQYASVRSLVNGFALGSCALHGGGCGGKKMEIYSAPRGRLLMCFPGREMREAQVLPDGRAFFHTHGSGRIKVLLPPSLSQPDGTGYDVDLQGNRLGAGR